MVFWDRWVTELLRSRDYDGKERGDLEIKDYTPECCLCMCGPVVLQKNQEQADSLPPPRTLIMDFTLNNACFEDTRRSDPETDGDLKTVVI